MKRLLTFLTLLTVFIGVGWAAEASFAPSDFSGQGTTSTGSPISATVNGVTFACDKGFGTTEIRCYSGGTITISSENTITGISFTFSGGRTGGLETSYTGLSTKSWERTLSSQARITSVTVTYTTGQTEPDPTTPSGTITFTPAAGEVTSGTTVAMSFSGTCTGIKYTTDGTSPSATNGTEYDASNPPEITGATTITAAAYNYSNSKYAFGTEATASYTVTIPSVNYDGTATFNATVDAGTSPLIKQPVTFACSNGVLNNGSEYRLYKSSTTTFSVPDGYKIVKIEFTCTASGSAQYGPGSFASQTGYSYDGNIGTWVGNAESVSFTASNNQVRCSLINVYYTAPASTGPEYYLVGEFNSWTQNADYKFFENNGTFTLDNVSLPANAQFKIIKVDNGITWYGGTGDVVYNIHHTHHTGLPMNGGQNYNIQSAGVTSFSFTLDNNTPTNLNVNREAKLYIKGDFNSWAEELMTATSNGWTTTQTIDANNEFGFVDEFGQFRGKEWTIWSEHMNGYEIPMETNGNYKMGIAGSYTLNVNSGLTTLVVNDQSQSSGDEFELVTDASTLNEGDLVVIMSAGTGSGYAISNTEKSNNRSAAGPLTITASKVTPDSDTQIFELEGDATGWYFKNIDGFYDGQYLYTDNNTKARLLSKATKDNYCKTTISIGGSDNAVITFQGINAYNVLRYNANNGSPLFACYTSGQANVYLYRKAGNALSKPTIEPATGNIKGGLVNVTITAAEGATIYYTTDGSNPTTSSDPYSAPFDVTGTGGQSKTVKAIAVLDGNVSDVASATYTFQAPSNPVITPDGGEYDGTQHVTISSTDGGIIYYLVDPETTPTNAADVINAGQVYTPGNTAITLEAGIHKVYAAVNLNGITSWAQESYTINADPMTLSFSPAAGTYVNAQSVTITANNAIGDYTIYYTTDGTEATASSTVYSGPITVAQDMTINAYAIDSRDQGLNGKEATASATYNIGVQPVEYSPLPGNYYKGSEDGDITVEMFSITPNAKIYYTMTDDGTEPADPSTSSTLFTGDIPLEVGKTYNFKAIAVAGQQVTPIAPATYTVSELQTGESGWVNINAMNIDDNYSTDEYLLNPVQVVYMSTWRNRGDKPEFCFIRDNSGYGMIYFGNSDVTAYNSWAKFQMGDWLPGNEISGTLNVWSDSFINELGGSSGTLSTWPSQSLGNNDILPEETTNLAITQGWTYEGSFTPSANDGYEDHIDPAKNLFGHYVHMRKNTIDHVTGAGVGTGKHTGIITDQSGVPLNYYDGLYLFSGYNNTPDYNQEFFDNIQNNGGTFDIYAIVYFYGPNAKKEEYSYAPYEIFPIDFLYIYKPMFNIQSGTYMEPQTVTLTCATEGAQIWYKTSEMEDYALYTGPITVDATTTIDAYSTIPTKYNDVMESAINSITINIGSIEAPVITEPSVVKTVGESVTTSITCATDGATIYYTTDGSDPKTSETRQVYSSDLTFDETTTVRAIAYKEVEGTGYYSAEAEAMTYTFVKSNGIIYNLVTSNTQLNENSVYVIVNKANNMAVGTTQNENNRAADGVKFVDEATKTQVFGNDELAQFTLKKVGNNWYLQTANSTENGYLYVGNGNTLLTEATADGNAEATINIDGNSEAHISFMYNYETVRYLRYWLGGKAFSTYTSEASNLPVSLYYIQATPLATIEREGVTTEGKNQYTIADQLIAVYADDVKGILWCKDQGNVSIDKTYIHDGQVDFLYNDSQAQNGRDWDQSNWIALQFSDPTATNNIGLLLKNAEGKYIKPATVQGYYIDDVNFTLQMAEDKLELVTQADAGYDEQIYTPNVYCASNFLPDNLNIHGSIENGDGGYTGDPQINTQNYFFMNPKIQEVCEITYAQWDAAHECFTVPSASGFDGAFNVGWGYNVLGNLKGSLQDEHVYRFKAVVQRSNKESYGPKNVTESFAHITVYPVDLDTREGGSEIVTAINTVDVNGKAVKSVKYVNVAGIVSDVPFQGVNIVVTEYTDGSRTTTKMLKK